MKSTVYAVHQPSRFDYEHKCMVPIDLSPVDKYGELRFIFTGNERPPCADDALPTMRSVLRGFKATDYLVITGDLDLFVWAAVLALQSTKGTLKLLKWSNRLKTYEVFNAPDGLLT